MLTSTIRVDPIITPLTLRCNRDLSRWTCQMLHCSGSILRRHSDKVRWWNWPWLASQQPLSGWPRHKTSLARIVPSSR